MKTIEKGGESSALVKLKKSIVGLREFKTIKKKFHSF